MGRHQWDQPTVRQWLLEDALQFVCTARRLPGVLRIALLGSLAATKPEPKDVDLLLTVTPPGHYMGRLCPWKLCAPGVRASRDALHCGWRPFLHDDLATIQLTADLVLHPPLELFPEVIRRAPLPVDVETILAGGVQQVGS
jgi:hypothetical protein